MQISAMRRPASMLPRHAAAGVDERFAELAAGHADPQRGRIAP